MNDNDLREVVFSDKNKFNLDGPGGYNFYFHDVRKENKFLSRHHTRVGDIMVWVAISCYGTVDLVIQSTLMTGNHYKNLLELVFRKITDLFGPIRWV